MLAITVSEKLSITEIVFDRKNATKILPFEELKAIAPGPAPPAAVPDTVDPRKPEFGDHIGAPEVGGAFDGPTSPGVGNKNEAVIVMIMRAIALEVLDFSKKTPRSCSEGLDNI